MSNKPTLDKLIVWYQHAFTDPKQEKSPSRILKQQLTQLIADIVGEDEKNDQEDFSDPLENRGYDSLNTRNNLRFKQRQRAKDFGVEL